MLQLLLIRACINCCVLSCACVWCMVGVGVGVGGWSVPARLLRTGEAAAGSTRMACLMPLVSSSAIHKQQQERTSNSSYPHALPRAPTPPQPPVTRPSYSTNAYAHVATGLCGYPLYAHIRYTPCRHNSSIKGRTENSKKKNSEGHS
jgi:hypothetical protein